MKRDTASDLEAVAESVVRKSRPFQILAVLAASCFAAGGGLALYGSRYVTADAYADQTRSITQDIARLKEDRAVMSEQIKYIRSAVDETRSDVKTLLQRR